MGLEIGEERGVRGWGWRESGVWGREGFMRVGLEEEGVRG